MDWTLDFFRAKSTQRFDNGDVVGHATVLGVDVAMLWAFLDVESAARGFREDGLLVMRFEAHIFLGRMTNDHAVPSAVHGDPNSYVTLQSAFAASPTHALASTSWGLPQIMGFNHKMCGLPTPEDLVAAMAEGEVRQVALLATFINNHEELHKAVKRRDFHKVARLYNGPAQRGYDERLAQRYDARVEWLKGGLMRVLHTGLAGDDVLEVQRMLNKDPGPQPLAEDGRFGSGTKVRVQEFQAAHGLTSDGVIGPKTWSKLKEVYNG